MVYVHKGPMSLDDYIKMNRFHRLIYQLRYDPRRVLDLTLLLVSLFVEWCGTALVAPLTPWLVKDLDPSMDEGSAASIFMASFSLGTLIASLVTGPLSDKFGRRPIFLGAMLIYTISYFLVANAWDIASFAGFRALGGVSAGTRPVLYAFITDSSRQEDMRFYGSCISICNTVGGALGPTIGGWLASVGMSFPFYFMGVVAAVLFILEFLFLRETKPWENKPKWLTLEYYECWKQNPRTNVTDDDEAISNDATVASGNTVNAQHSGPENPEKALSPMDQAKDMSLGKWSKKNKWFIPTLICLCLAAFAGQYTGNSWSTVFGVLGADRYNLSEQQNGEAMGIQAVVVIVCTILYIYVSDKIRPGMVAAFGFCLVVLAVIVPFIYSLWGTIVIGMCVYVGVTFFFAGMAYCSALISPPKSRGLINSISMGMTNVGGVLGPLVGGQLYDLNVADPYYVMCGLGVLGIASSIVITGGTTYTEKLLGVNSS
ncbi:hypothetical protein FOL47_007393 [Perkinsus chesapeaki]|uniref:Major facilitator superfamily (MFS) profile domain-containing protein n=1 Tax=Perkinsus chesapeaki TaxID=330153 RepID=A0A7J6LKT7_PERCH|nr:hypothetical protein FOL47_007393 [Perkinsus chesapeaki]